MRVLMLHNRYLQPGGEDSSFDAEVSILRENGCEVTPYEENNVRIQDPIIVPRGLVPKNWNNNRGRSPYSIVISFDHCSDGCVNWSIR